LVFLTDVVASEIVLDTLCFHQVRHPTKEIGSGNHLLSAAEFADVRDILIAGQCRFYLIEIAADKETKGLSRIWYTEIVEKTNPFAAVLLSPTGFV
jgi:hypothetical protein